MTNDGDPLSPLAHDIIEAGSYDLLTAPHGTPDKARSLLGKVTPDQLFTVPVVNVPAAYEMHAGQCFYATMRWPL